VVTLTYLSLHSSFTLCGTQVSLLNLFTLHDTFIFVFNNCIYLFLIFHKFHSMGFTNYKLGNIFIYTKVNKIIL
jgi:hypothetical protein